MPKFKMEFDKERFVKQKEEEAERRNSSSNKDDLRVLNYYDLGPKQSVTIRLIPSNGMIYSEWSTHGNNIRGVKPTQCIWTATGDECPVCQQFFDQRDKIGKDEARKLWGRKNYTIAQCIVIDEGDLKSVNEAEDGNPVKLIYLPYGVKELVDDAILDGEYDNPLEQNIIIKRGNDGKFGASKLKPPSDALPDEFYEDLESGDAYLYDLEEVTHTLMSKDDLTEWLEEAIEKAANTKSKGDKGDNGDGGDDDDDDDDVPARTKSVSASSLSERYSKRKRG